MTSAAVDKTYHSKSEFYNNWRNDTALQQGENIEVVSLVKNNAFDKNYFVGVALDIRNKSPFKLGQPTFYPHCRGGKQEDGKFFKFHKRTNDDVNPGFREVFLFHNRQKSHVSSCGAVAWQVQEKRGENYQALKTNGGLKLLLVVSWRLGYQACDDDWGSPNKLTMRLERTPMSWAEEDLEAWYYEYDEWYNGNAKKTRVDVERGDGSRAVFQSKDGVSAKAHLTQGCQALLTLELVGAAEQSSVLNIGGSGTSSVSFAILIAGLCVITIIGLLIIVCRIKALGRRQRLQRDYLQDGSGDEVLKMNPDKVLSDQENSDEEIMNISSRPRTVSFSDKVS